MPFLHTTRFHRGKLPHWEVEAGRYFVTVRLADSIPRNAMLRLQEIHQSIAEITARSDAFVSLQRQYFQTMEKYLDVGGGAVHLRYPSNAAIIIEELQSLTDWSVDVPHYTIMPNHWHVLIVPDQHAKYSLSDIMK